MIFMIHCGVHEKILKLHEGWESGSYRQRRPSMQMKILQLVTILHLPVFDLYTLCWSFGILEAAAQSFWFMKGNNLYTCVNAIWVNVNYWRECLSYYVRKKYTIAETEKNLGESCCEYVSLNLFFIIYFPFGAVLYINEY